MKEELESIYNSLKYQSSTYSLAMGSVLDKLYELTLDEDETDSLGDFYEFPVPSPGNDFEDFDERYLLLEGKTLRLVHEKYGTLETTMTFNKNEYGLKYSNILSWLREDEDDTVWTALELSSSEDSGWKAYVDVDITRYVKKFKKLASTLEPGTLFLGKVDGVTRNLLTTSKYTPSMTCVPIGDNTGYDPKDVEVVEVLATGISEEGIWL